MKIIECFAENFGTLSKARYVFDGGLNTVYAENGNGKSTLAAFIKSMFYGLPETKRRDAGTNDRIKYIPWQGGAFGGYLTFLAGGKRYRVERFFGGKLSGGDDVFALFDLDSNKKSGDFSENVGSELFGINADSFLRTVYIPQTPPSYGGANDLSARLNNLVHNTADAHGYEKTAENLKIAERRIATTGSRGLLYDAERKAAALETRLSGCERAAETAAAMTEELREKERIIAETEGKLSRIREDIEASGAILLQAERRRYYARLKERLEAAEKEKNALAAGFRSGVPKREDIRAAYEKSVRLIKAESACRGPSATDRIGGSVSADANRVGERGNAYSADSGKTANNARVIRAALLAAAVVLLLSGIAIVFFNAALGISLSGLAVVSLIIRFMPFIRRGCEKNKNSNEDENGGAENKNGKAKGNMNANGVKSDFGGAGNIFESANESVANSNENADGVAGTLADGLKGFLSEYFDFGDGYDGAAFLSAAKELENRLDAYENAERSLGMSAKELLDFTDVNPEYKEFENGGIIPSMTVEIDGGENPSNARVVRAKETLGFTEVNQKYKKSENGGTGLCGIGEISGGAAFPDIEKMKREERETAVLLTSLRRSADALGAKIDAAYEEASRAGEYAAALAAVTEEHAELGKRLDALRLARELLTRARENLSGSYLKPLYGGFAKYLSLFDGGEKFVIDTDLGVNVESGGKIREIGYFSEGTREMLDICMRFALAELLFKDERPFMILDDPFANLDDAKLERGKKLLLALSEEMQIIYLTCHNSRVI
ncbi:MAG: AAA family ATPase [Clostridiales bacterium]|jgi:energy-coupling factor transporter ATP-binding protein EcfA2|nr:AAA family ATPase [Clostridiales bacterium]